MTFNTTILPYPKHSKHWLNFLIIIFLSMDKSHPHWPSRCCCSLTNASIMRSVSVLRRESPSKRINWTLTDFATTFGHWCWMMLSSERSMNSPRWTRWRLWPAMARVANLIHNNNHRAANHQQTALKFNCLVLYLISFHI